MKIKEVRIFLNYFNIIANARTSPINLDNVDYDKYPKFKNAKPKEVIVGPGDSLFVPAYWFHQVHSSCRSIAVNFWFDTHSNRDFEENFKSDESLPSYKILEHLLKNTIKNSKCSVVKNYKPSK